MNVNKSKNLHKQKIMLLKLQDNSIQSAYDTKKICQHFQKVRCCAH